MHRIRLEIRRGATARARISGTKVDAVRDNKGAKFWKEALNVSSRGLADTQSGICSSKPCNQSTDVHPANESWFLTNLNWAPLCIEYLGVEME
tara:strand:- start:1605 stop:1883 length:279 start_codon:yes stop_codon:yes gene_type:complete